MVRAAVDICDFIKTHNATAKIPWKVRIGIHSGSAVAAIVGTKKYIYDIFGDSVNTASRMEAHSETNRINLYETTWTLVKDTFSFEQREPVEVKGKGKMKMYFLK